MRYVWLPALLMTLSMSIVAQVPDVNVNSRYTVESVDVLPVKAARLSQNLRNQIQNLVGSKFNQEALDEMKDRIRRELHVPSVAVKVERGIQPDHVKVIFEVAERRARVDLAVPKFLYQSEDGWSGELDANTRLGHNSLSLGVLSDGDTLVERYAGFRARFERTSIGSERVHLAFEFGTFHEQRNGATILALNASDVPGIYRERQQYEPQLSVTLLPGLAFSTGADFERLQTQFPAARIQASDAVVNTLRYHRRWEDSGSGQRELDAGYNLRAATNVLGSDFVYTRHQLDAAYRITHERHTVTIRFLSGVISGRAPLFERFVAGNGSLLCGWSKYDIAPLGGNRIVHGSVEYKYRIVEVFYDTGAVWDRGSPPIARNSLGVGVRKDRCMLAVAFPLHDGRVDPVFLAGMNF